MSRRCTSNILTILLNYLTLHRKVNYNFFKYGNLIKGSQVQHLYLYFVGIVGSVVNSSGHPLRDAKLSIMASHGHYEEGKISKNSARFVQMLSEGYHQINVSLKGYNSEKQTVYVSKGSLKPVKIVLYKGPYHIDDDDSNRKGSSTSSSGWSPSPSPQIYDQDYFYYPRKEFQQMKQSHPRHFDISR